MFDVMKTMWSKLQDQFCKSETPNTNQCVTSVSLTQQLRERQLAHHRKRVKDDDQYNEFHVSMVRYYENLLDGCGEGTSTTPP